MVKVYDPMSYIVASKAQDIKNIFAEHGFHNVSITHVGVGADMPVFILDIEKRIEKRIEDKIVDDIYDLLCAQKEAIQKDPKQYCWCTSKHIQRMNSMEEGEEYGYTEIMTPSGLEEYLEEKKRSFYHRPDRVKRLELHQAKTQYPLPLGEIKKDRAIEEQIESYATEQMLKKNLSEKTSGPYIDAFMRYHVNGLLSSSESSKDSSVTLKWP